jgi:hypothetical protein
MSSRTATEPKAVFEQLKVIGLAAAINKTMEGVYMQLDTSLNAFGVLEGLGVLTRANASGYAAQPPSGGP